MRAELISVGTELLLGDVVDTNASFLATRLAAIGIDVLRTTVVGDNLGRISAAVKEALGREADVVIVGGGLGPTADDLTREAVADACGVGLSLNQQALDSVKAWFAQRGRAMAESNRRQALFPEGAEVLVNSTGTAPGFLVAAGRAVIACLPGVPRELKAMFTEELEPRLRDLVAAREGGAIIHSRVLKFIGISESELAEMMADLLQGSNPTVAPLVGAGQVILRITAKAPTKARALDLIAPVEREIRRRAGRWLAATDDEAIEEVVGRLLRRAGLTLAVAESCTGGLISALITNVPGSSDYFNRGFITYANEAKEELLGVRASTLRDYGAVSPETCREMAVGARRRAKTDLAVAVTGIAGPGGGTETKPVGLVYIGVSGPNDRGDDDNTRDELDSIDSTVVEELRFAGPRDVIRQRSAVAALDLLRRRLLGYLANEGSDVGGGQKKGSFGWRRTSG